MEEIKYTVVSKVDCEVNIYYNQSENEVRSFMNETEAGEIGHSLFIIASKSEMREVKPKITLDVEFNP